MKIIGILNLLKEEEIIELFNNRAIFRANETYFNYNDSLEFINKVNENNLSIIGIEVFSLKNNSLVSYSNLIFNSFYDFKENWNIYISKNKIDTIKFIEYSFQEINKSLSEIDNKILFNFVLESEDEN